MSSDVEIGVWVDGVQKWVTGVTRRTTCHDLIKALLRSQDPRADDSDVINYVVVERWRKVERPLDHEQRILKVWRTWGEAVSEVRFSLRRVRDGDSVAGSCRSERSRRRHKWRAAKPKESHHHYNSNSSHHHHHHTSSHHPNSVTHNASNSNNDNCNNNPANCPTTCNSGTAPGTSRHHRSRGEEPKLSETVERLMRLVVAQGETIQTQLRRLQARESQIEQYEHEMHLLRVSSLGNDYLLHTYLKDDLKDDSKDDSEAKDEPCSEEKSNDSGVVTEGPNETLETVVGETSCENLEELLEEMVIMNRLEEINASLMKEEENLSGLTAALTAVESEHEEEARVLTKELERVAQAHAALVAEVRSNEQRLRELDTTYWEQRRFLEWLIQEDADSDKETRALQSHLNYIIHLPPSAFRLPPEDHSPAQVTLKVGESPRNRLHPPKHPPSGATGSTVGPKPTSYTPLDNSSTTTSSRSVCSSARTTTTSRVTQVDEPHEKDGPPPLPSCPPPRIEEEEDSANTSSPSVSSRSSTSSEGGTNVAPCSKTSNIEGDAQRRSRTSVPSRSGTSSGEGVKDTDSTDSNSDTGLSSLHSSSDESGYVLDTLV